MPNGTHFRIIKPREGRHAVASGVSLGTWLKSIIKPREGRHKISLSFAQR